MEKKILYTNKFIVLLTLTCSIYVFSQKKSENEDIYKNALVNLYSHPEKTITISEYLSINADSDEERSNALNLKAEAQILQGNYIVALNALLESLHLNSVNDDSTELLRTNLILGDLYRKLGVIPKAEERLNLIEKKFDNNFTDNPEKTSLYIDFLTTKSILLCEQKKYLKATEVIDDALLKKFSTRFPYQVSWSYDQLAKAYGMNQQWDRSLQYAEIALQLSTMSGLEENFMAYAELDVAKANFIKKNKQQYLIEIPRLLILSEKVNDIVLKKNIHQFLAEFYLSEGNNTKYQLHNLKYLELNESINSAQQKASDLILSLTESDFKAKDHQRYKTNYILIWVIGFAFLVLGFVFWFRFRTRQNYNYYKEYISKLKKTQKEEEIIITDKDVEEMSKTPQLIPEKTEQILLEKLLAFEDGKDFTKKSLTLHSLAKELDTNTRYLSEIVNKHKQKNFNSYINELRINYIINKLRNEPSFLNYKISYLAEESGFSSHTSFSTVFKTVTGIPPKEFISFIKKELSIAN
ncbi:helix-turn-helix transcriptional regulator [Epilithonimonas sp.]|uniref:helix-turn-helix transcriptional regulator n=1 Tax=Epilithonimonas sp. TaxID=2894511 RepID=UPI0028A04CCC|nr:helix-turn-helix transcriptional regulator [Epilithonimonas sp.]